MTECYFCSKPAQPEHSPCCSSKFHGRSLCCEHYCRSHFVEVDKCSPESHAARNQQVSGGDPS